MKKVNIVKNNDEYYRIIKLNKPFIYKEFMVFLEKNENDIYKFGFSINKRICKAHMRNKIKRQLKDIIDKRKYQNGFNCIIMVRKSILQSTYHDMEKNLMHIFGMLKIFEGERNEKKANI